MIYDTDEESYILIKKQPMEDNFCYYASLLMLFPVSTRESLWEEINHFNLGIGKEDKF